MRPLTLLRIPTKAFRAFGARRLDQESKTEIESGAGEPARAAAAGTVRPEPGAEAPWGDERFVELFHVSKAYPNPRGEDVEVVRDFNLLMREGELVAVIGHSGCGKSTVLTMIAGLNSITSGGIVVAGREIDGPGPDRAVVFQAPCLLPWLSARQNVQIAASQGLTSRTRRAAAAAADEYLELVGISDAADQLPAQLSLGTQQCVSLARALAMEPRFLLLDEPFSQLDSLTRFELQDLLLRVWEKSGKTVVMVTHDIDEALVLADRVLVFSGRPGRIEAEIRVDLPRPRDRSESEFHSLQDRAMAALAGSSRDRGAGAQQP